ncbi:hypothetical protein MTO96_049055 [Rhipicephalus appendiculatus]
MKLSTELAYMTLRSQAEADLELSPVAFWTGYIIRACCLLHELNISLEDLLKAHKRGRWCVVGSAWAGNKVSLDRKTSAPSVQPDVSS